MKAQLSILVLAMTISSAEAASIGVFGYANTQAVNLSTSLGYSAERVTDFSQLSNYDVLWGLNGSNGSHLSQLTAFNSEIASFVQNGGVFMYHDRYVTNAETVLPGADNFDIQRDFSDSRNIQVVNSSTQVTNGPGGLIDNSTLDNGNFSSHGFTLESSIDQLFTGILSTSNATELVDFVYAFGMGDVYYSSIPLDYYLGAYGRQANFRDVYAPNVISYGAELAAGSGIQSVPEPNALLLMGLAALTLGARKQTFLPKQAA